LRGTLLVILVLLALLAVAGVIGYVGWQQLADVEMGLHGFIALGLGVGLSILLWVGLMFLVFYSSRKGYDDEAGRD
jgi:hypothetical protein